MLDTVKLAIPLNKAQHKRISGFSDTGPQWVYGDPTTGEFLFVRRAGLVQADGESFHRELRWEVSERFNDGDCFLTIEFSLPKFWYGHNIRLLYEIITPLIHLKRLIEHQFGLNRNRLPDVEAWQVRRADVCYAWNLRSDQKLAYQVLDSLKRLHFPRKKPVIRPESIFFGGSTYSVKFYLKLPEFKAHDRKALLKQHASLEWIDHLERIAAGVLRFEVLLRQRYLKRQGIKTVSDLVQEKLRFVHDPPLPDDKDEAWGWILAIHLQQLHAAGFNAQEILNSHQYHGVPEELKNFKGGEVITSSPVVIHCQGRDYAYPGGTLTVERVANPILMARAMLEKFVGRDVGMNKADEVMVLLSAHYKAVKVARLTSFWLFVQKFGSSSAKDNFGHNSYYYSKRELTKAGVSLIEPPRGKIVNLDDFRFVIPSHYVANAHDDFRDSENLLNLFKAQ